MRLNKIYMMIGIFILISMAGCQIDHKASGEVDVTGVPEAIDINITVGLQKALERLEPFALVGVELNPLRENEEELVCGIVHCVTVGDFRRATIFMIENPLP